MKTFREIEYIRPDFEAEKQNIKAYIEAIPSAKNYEELSALFHAREQEAAKFDQMYWVAFIRNTMDARDAFYEEELMKFNQAFGELDVLKQEAAQKLLESPYLDELEQEIGSSHVNAMKGQQRTTSPEVAEDMLQDSKLHQAYNKVVSANSANLGKLMKQMNSMDREERAEGLQKWAGLYEEMAPDLDNIYDQMMEVRTRYAQKLGFEGYIPYIYTKYGRDDYNPENLKVLRKKIKDYIVPICEQLYKEQKERLGVDTLTWHDEMLTDPDGNATPYGTKDEMLEAAREMYHELSKETGEFFDFMMEHDLFDLESRTGKQPGGYCELLAADNAPFIFANFNGTSADVDVLTHEAGHAFEAYMASPNCPAKSTVFAHYEVAEIHSMAMEYFTYPWMEKFFGDRAEQYRVRHLEQCIKNLPFMVCVDEFQHRAFENQLDAAGRRRLWKELEETYMPWRTYDGNEFLENGGLWMHKLHIFITPFHYIEYVLAQICALQLYELMLMDKETAWEKYCALCKVGGKLGYFKTLEHVGLKNPFAEGTVEHLAEFLKECFNQ